MTSGRGGTGRGGARATKAEGKKRKAAAAAEASPPSEAAAGGGGGAEGSRPKRAKAATCERSV